MTVQQTQFPVADPQIEAVRDDGSNEGITRVEIATSELVPVDFTQMNTYLLPATGGVANFQYGIPYSSSGSSQGLDIWANTGFVKVYFVFFGRTLGLRYNDFAGAGVTKFSVTVDGGDLVYVDRQNEIYTDREQTVPKFLNHEEHTITHRDLKNTIHFGILTFAIGESAFLLGMLCEKNGEWNILSRPVHTHSVPLAVPTTPTAYQPFGVGMAVLTTPFLKVSKIQYCNPTASDIVVTWNTNIIFTVKANDIREFDFPVNIGNLEITHSAASTGMFVQAWGGYV